MINVVDRFQDLSKVKNPTVSKAKVQQLLHDMVSQNFCITFSDAVIHLLEINVLNIEENYLTWVEHV